MSTPTASDVQPSGSQAGDDASVAAVPKMPKVSRRALWLAAAVAAGGVVLILRAWEIYPFSDTIVRTDNAYVRGQMTVLSPQVSGYISAVLVKDFEYVKAAQVLVRIDDRIYRARVEQARAQLDNARAQLAMLEQTEAQNEANLAGKRAALVSASAEASRAASDLARAVDLADKGSVSLRERDQANATAELGRANVLKARADIAIAQEAVKATRVSRASLRAEVEAAEAALHLAQIDLDNTVVRAPVDGQVSEASARLGQYVTSGSQLLFLVPEARWVVANFKETQTGRMHVGQRARFTVDGLEDASVYGSIERIAPATGSEFSVLRSDNATGNFTKVVQRLPVRIAIDPGQEVAQRLRPGMSVVVEVDTAASVATHRGQRSGQ